MSKQLTAGEAADQFRLSFFQRVIEGEQQRLAQIKKKQRECYHRYEFFSTLSMNKTEWICSRCDHVIQRTVSIPVQSLSPPSIDPRC